jgi:hypothetical protein
MNSATFLYLLAGMSSLLTTLRVSLDAQLTRQKAKSKMAKCFNK